MIASDFLRFFYVGHEAVKLREKLEHSIGYRQMNERLNLILLHRTFCLNHFAFKHVIVSYSIHTAFCQYFLLDG